MKPTKLSAVSPSELDLAPFHVLVCLLEPEEIEIAQSAEIVCRELGARGLKVVLDDRAMPAAVKLDESFRLGLPARICVASSGLERGQVELQTHFAKVPRQVPLEDVAEVTLEVVRELKKL